MYEDGKEKKAYKCVKITTREKYEGEGENRHKVSEEVEKEVLETFDYVYMEDESDDE